MDKTKAYPNRHVGYRSTDCTCGLVHDDEIGFIPRNKKKEELVKLLGAKCNNPKCRWLNKDGTLGCKEEYLLQLDHVFDDGAFERKRFGSNAGVYSHAVSEIKAGSNRYQLLCANCNWLKRRHAWFSRKGFQELCKKPAEYRPIFAGPDGWDAKDLHVISSDSRSTIKKVRPESQVRRWVSRQFPNHVKIKKV